MSQLQPGRPEAAAVVWSWKRASPADSEKVGAGSATRARLRGVLQASVGAIVGLLVHRTLSPSVGTAILSVASIILLAALLSPRVLYSGIERLFSVTGRALARGVTWISLVTLLYLVFFPFGVLFRRGRRDRMRRRFEPEATTYWTPLDSERPTPESYERLY